MPASRQSYNLYKLSMRVNFKSAVEIMKNVAEMQPNVPLVDVPVPVFLSVSHMEVLL